MPPTPSSQAARPPCVDGQPTSAPHESSLPTQTFLSSKTFRSTKVECTLYT